jgi:SWI/SNF-related matrix-associated actin-dependent regulator of chromatin subfamily A3
VDADRRIALTGTPIQNKIEDIWALFKFLRLKPIDEKEQFTKYISAPCKIGNQVGVARLQLVMRCCTLRRTKDSTADDGRRILNLPPRKESQMWLELREDERAIYDARHAQGKAELENFQQEEVGSRNYAHVLQQILRLRQTCNHVDLAQMDPVEEDYDGTIMDYEVAVAGIQAHGLNQNRGVSVVCFMKDGEGANCAECNYDYNDYFPSMATAELEDSKLKKKMPTPLLLTKCLHIYCESLSLSSYTETNVAGPKCFKGSVHPGYSKRMKEQAARACGICQTMLRLPYDVTEIVPPDSAEAQVPADQPKRKRKRYVRPPGEKPNLSTKMQFLYDELMAASKKNPNSKNYDPFALPIGDEIEELDESGRPYIVKSVVLYVPSLLFI